MGSSYKVGRFTEQPVKDSGKERAWIYGPYEDEGGPFESQERGRDGTRSSGLLSSRQRVPHVLIKATL